MTTNLPLPAPLEPVREALERICTPGVGLYFAAEATGCLLGGVPDVPVDFRWPSVDDRPMGFLAQLDLAEIHAVCTLDWLPACGRLLFFYDVVEESWGYEPGHARYWRVLLIPDDAPLGPATVPDAPTRNYIARRFSGSEMHEEAASEIVEIIFERVYLAPRAVDTFPALDDPMLMAGVFDSGTDGSENGEDGEDSELAEVYGSFRSQRLPNPQHQIGGLPFTLQQPRIDVEAQILDQGLSLEDYYTLSAEEQSRATAGFEDWQLLLQLDSDDSAGWMWGDCGALYFLVRGEDARRGDFSRVRAILQCY